MKSFAILATALALAANARAQASSDLAIGGTLVGGGTLTFTVSGAPAHKLTVIFAAQNPGTTIYDALTIDLALPLFGVAMGLSDATGSLVRSFNLPNLPPGVTIAPFTLSAQAVSVDFGGFLPIPPAFAKSDVETFTIVL
jgi:hypothetical protein